MIPQIPHKLYLKYQGQQLINETYIQVYGWILNHLCMNFNIASYCEGLFVYVPSFKYSF